MRFKEYIEEVNERMILSLKIVKKGTADVYANPASIEIHHAFNSGNSARFVLNYKEKIIYLWSGKYFHDEIVPEIKNFSGDKYREDFNDDNRGRAYKLSGNKLSEINLDKRIPESEQEWVSEYLDLSNVEYEEDK